MEKLIRGLFSACCVFFIAHTQAQTQTDTEAPYIYELEIAESYPYGSPLVVGILAGDTQSLVCAVGNGSNCSPTAEVQLWGGENGLNTKTGHVEFVAPADGYRVTVETDASMTPGSYKLFRVGIRDVWGNVMGELHEERQYILMIE